MATNKLEPTNVLTIYGRSVPNITLVVTDKYHNILDMSCISRYTKDYTVRNNVLNQCITLIKNYDINTILLEQNKLMIDTFSKYPDPYILSNIILNFGINITIQDAFYNTVKYILEIPHKDWTQQILNRNTRYSIDLFKSHVQNYSLSEETLNKIDNNNYYECVCFSESVLYDCLMNKKYQINKE